MMIPAVLEKFVYGFTLVVLYLQGRIVPSEMVGLSDLILGLLFAIAYGKTVRNGPLPETPTMDGL
jgi:hypothetical protein